MYQRSNNGLWVEKVEVNGKLKYVTSKTKSGLIKKLTGISHEEEHGALFSDVADDWEMSNAKHIEPTTAGSYAPHVRRAKEFFAGQYIKDITPDQCQAYVDYLVQQDFGRDTVRRGMNVLGRIFSFAMTQKNSSVRYNPCSAVTIPRGLAHGRREPPTKEQIVKVTPDTEMGLFAWFLLYTGMRRGELLALRWEDIDFEKDIIYIENAVQMVNNKARIKAPKTEAGKRTVPLLKVLKKVLTPGKGYIFGSETEPMTGLQFSRKWNEWCLSVGLAELEIKKHKGSNKHVYKKKKIKPLVTPHQFRHQYATMLYYAGAEEMETKLTMGHSSIVVTREIYTHIKERDAESAVGKKLEAYLSKK